MKIIRSNVFETNSSSAHSLVLNKENKVFEEQFEWFNHIFGTTYDDICDKYNYDWDEDGNKVFIKREYEFNFCRGEVRVYDDFIHKTAFLIAYYKYKDEEKLIKHILEYSSQTARKHLSSFDKNYDKELLEYLISTYIDKGFKRDDPDYWSDSYISSEFSDSSSLISKIAHNDELLEQFLFNSYSYISISGDEYQCAYLKLVGTENEYYDYYNRKSKESEEAFSKRVDEIYPKDKYEVDYHI